MPTDSPALIEAAAKAIYLQRNGDGCAPWHKIGDQHREPYRKDVRAVMQVFIDWGCIDPS